MTGFGNIGLTRYVTSTDNGSAWSAAQSLPSPPKLDACFVNGQGVSVYCIYSTFGTQPNIERITSTDGGATWSAAVPILNTNATEKPPFGNGTPVIGFGTAVIVPPPRHPVY